MSVVHTFVFINHFLERSILGLDFEVRGHENLPEGACIIAAKHQSAYETTKLHILFEDPAIILKKELLKIPLWGLYLAKSDVIAIDRSSPKAAISRRCSSGLTDEGATGCLRPLSDGAAGDSDRRRAGGALHAALVRPHP